MNIRTDRNVLLKITDEDNERNIYVHPNRMARDIFWQRLEYAFKSLKRYSSPTDRVLDFGGGSGVFLKALTHFYNAVSVIDLDIEDARNFVKYFNLENVTMINENINQYNSVVLYDTIIATDVLEHFSDLQEPLGFFEKYLKQNGILLVTLPTENWLYELGRKVVNKNKPEDHYHTSKEVLAFLKNHGFKLIETRYVPRYLIPIPLFEVAVLRKNNR